MAIRIVVALVVATVLVAEGSQQQACLDVRTFGAVPNGGRADWMNNTVAMQKALNQASKTRGCVVIQGGDYYVQEIYVKSYSVLRIEGDSRVIATITKPVLNVTKKAIVHVMNSVGVIIEGSGAIHGDAENDISYYSPIDDRFQPAQPDGGRPHNLQISNSTDVIIRGISLTNSTDWTFRMIFSKDIYVDNVFIYGDSRWPNNDGFDPESSCNVTLINSFIDVADDGVCPKATPGYPVIGLTVRNTTIRSKSHAIKFGSNTDALMRDILFDNITITDSNGGMSIQQRGAGNIENVTWSNIISETRYVAPRWWGNGEWVSITSEKRNMGDIIGNITNITFINITATTENGGLFSGRENGIHGLRLENVHVKIAAWSNYSMGKGPTCKDTRGENITCMGTRDYRPSLLEDSGKCSYYCRTEGKGDGIQLERVHGAVFENVIVEFLAPHASWYGKCLTMDNETAAAGVIGAKDITCINGEL